VLSKRNFLSAVAALACTALNAEFFRDCDLNVLDSFAAPGMLEDCVRKP